MTDLNYAVYKRQYSNDPAIWGASAWRFIHTAAAHYPVNPTRADREKYQTFFLVLPDILPCFQCGQNMKLYIQSDYPRFVRAFQNQDTLFRWTVDFHNHVNTKERDAINPLQQQQVKRGHPPNQPKRTIL